MEEVKVSEQSDFSVQINDMETYIDHIIQRHSSNKVEINNLALECMTALTASNSKSYELNDKSKFKYLIDSFNGKNKKLISEMNTSLASAQHAAQLTLQKLAESNLMSFELISAVNFKLNNAIKYVNNEVKDIYSSMLTLFRESQNEIWEINTRLDKIERNLELLNWLNSLEFRIYKGKEYSELSLCQKISVVTRDFFDISGGEIRPNDLLSLKSSLKTLNIRPNDEIPLIDFLNDLSSDSDLMEILNGNVCSNNANQLPIAAYLSNVYSFKSDKRFIIDQVIEELSTYSINQKPEVIVRNLSQRYVNDYLQYDLTSKMKIFDLILLILLHLEQTKKTVFEGVDSVEVEMIEEEEIKIIENDVPSNLNVLDMININRIYHETDEYYYFFEDINLIRVSKISQIKETIYRVQKHKKGIGLGFVYNWDIMLLRDDYIVYRIDSIGNRDYYKLCIFSINQQKETIIYNSNKRFLFGLDNDNNSVYYFENEDDNYILSEMIIFSLSKYDVVQKIHKQITKVKIKINDAFKRIHNQDYVNGAIGFFTELMLTNESPTEYEGFLTVNNGKVLIEPNVTSHNHWCILIKENDFTFYTIPESLVLDKHEAGKYRKHFQSGYYLNVNFNWNKEVFEVEYFPFEKGLTIDKLTSYVNQDGSCINLVIDDDGIFKLVFRNDVMDSVYPMNISDFSRKYRNTLSWDNLKKNIPYNKEILIRGRFSKLNVVGSYLYTENLVDNKKIYRYNLNDLDEVQVVEL